MLLKRALFHSFLWLLNILIICCASQSCMTLWDPMDCSPPGSSVCGDSLGRNPGVGFHALLHGIFPTQDSNPGLPHCRWILYHLSHQRSPRILEWVAYPFSRGSPWPKNQTRVSCITGRFFASWPLREACTHTHTHTHTHTPHIFFIHSSVDGCLCCLHVLATVTSTSVNLRVHVSFQIRVSLGVCNTKVRLLGHTVVNKTVWNAVLWCSLKNDRMISVHFQGKPFNVTVIEVYAPNTNAKEAEVE